MDFRKNCYWAPTASQVAFLSIWLTMNESSKRYPFIFVKYKLFHRVSFMESKLRNVGRESYWIS